jgi:hypothetical protein
MKRSAFSSLFGLAAAAVLGTALAAGIAAPEAEAANIGVLPVGGSYSDTLSSSGADINASYNFELAADASNVSLLASAFSQTTDDIGVDLLTISLFDSSNTLLASASGAPTAFFDSFANSGIALNAGNYLFTLFADVTTGKSAFVGVALAVNPVSSVPIPGAAIMLLTGLAAIGGMALHRRKAALAA